MKNIVMLLLFSFSLLFPSPVLAEGPVDFIKGQVQVVKTVFGKEGTCVPACRNDKPYCSFHRLRTCEILPLGHCDEDNDWVACEVMILQDGTPFCTVDDTADPEVCPILALGGVSLQEITDCTIGTRDGRPYCANHDTADPKECPLLGLGGARLSDDQEDERNVYRDEDDYVRPSKGNAVGEIVGRLFPKPGARCDDSVWSHDRAACDVRGHEGRYCGIIYGERPGPWAQLRPVGTKLFRTEECGDGRYHSAYTWWGSSSTHK